MRKETDKYTVRTNYFTKEWTWLRRGVALSFLIGGAFIFPLDEDLYFLKIIFVILFTFYFIAKPKDDLGIDENYLYHIKTSVIKPFTKIDKYKLSDLCSIRCGGIHSDKWELIDLFNGGGSMGGHTNQLEMTFKDNSSKSLDFAISRDQLNEIVTIAKKISNKQSLTTAKKA